VVTITAKASPKLTLERLWYAVEQGKGGPSKLMTPQATYAWSPPEQLQPGQQRPADRYSIEVSSLQNNDSAQRIANQLYSVRGVQNVSADIKQRKLFVQSANGAILSPWALATAVEQAMGEPIAVGGPYGVLTIERSAEAEPATATKPTYSHGQGGIR
jgi:hypothetical protein